MPLIASVTVASFAATDGDIAAIKSSTPTTPMIDRVFMSTTSDRNYTAPPTPAPRRHLAQRRYLHVDPANRLVADSLEADWNGKLRALHAAQEQYEEQCKNDRAKISEQQQARIAALAHDFPQLWQNPKTPGRERKRLVRLLLEDVTLIKNGAITAHVRFKGGITRTLTVPLPLNAWQQRITSSEVVREIDRLLDHHTYCRLLLY